MVISQIISESRFGHLCRVYIFFRIILYLKCYINFDTYFFIYANLIYFYIYIMFIWLFVSCRFSIVFLLLFLYSVCQVYLKGFVIHYQITKQNNNEIYSCTLFKCFYLMLQNYSITENHKLLTLWKGWVLLACRSC